jgi:hypothetical protein
MRIEYKIPRSDKRVYGSVSVYVLSSERAQRTRVVLRERP